MSRFLLGAWIGAVAVPAVVVWRITRDMNKTIDLALSKFEPTWTPDEP